MLFIGAGASASFGKPTTSELKQILRQKYGIGIRVNFLQGLLGYDEFPDIEHVLQAAVEIRDFLKETIGGKFINHLARNNGLLVYRDNLTNNYVPFKDTIEEWTRIIRTLEDEVFNNYRWNHNHGSAVKAIYEPIITYLKSISKEVIISTTNYDRAIENFCERGNYRYVDGFENIKGTYRWNNGFYYSEEIDYASPRATVVVLYKLHGSLDWKRRTDQIVFRTGEEGRPVDTNYQDNLVIYPTLSPKRVHQENLFRDIFNEFNKKLANADVCIVIGFSFRDSYLADTFVDFINNGKQLIVISPNALDSVYHELLKKEIPGALVEDINITCKLHDKNIILIREYLKQDTVQKIMSIVKNIIES